MPAAQARTNLPRLAWGGAGGTQGTVEALECPQVVGGGRLDALWRTSWADVSCPRSCIYCCSFMLYGSLLTFLLSFFETQSHSVALTGLDGAHYVD